jgi:hypothetical protein
MHAKYSDEEQVGSGPLLAVARAICPPGGTVEIWQGQGLEVRVTVRNVCYWCASVEAGVIPDYIGWLRRSTNGPQAAFLAWSSLADYDEAEARRVTLGAGSDIAAATVAVWAEPFDMGNVATLRLLGEFARTASAVLNKPRRAYFSQDDLGWTLFLQINDRHAIKACTINNEVQFYEEKGPVVTRMLPIDVQRLFGEIGEPGTDSGSIIRWAIRLVIRFAEVFPPQWSEIW